MSDLFKCFDGMAWPNPGEDLEEVAYRLVHATPSRTDLLIAASTISAYKQLIAVPERHRRYLIKNLRSKS